MKVLGLDTSCARGSVAATAEGAVRAYVEQTAPDGHDEQLLDLIDATLDQARWQRGDLERIAVGIGPGSFTGLRVGIALAQGIGHGLGIEVVGVSSLQCMAHALELGAGSLCCAVLDARRGELFVAVYDALGQEHSAPQALAVADFAAFLTALGARCITVGQAVTNLDLQLPEGVCHHTSAESDLPSAKHVALLGARLTPRAPLPEYLRGANAQLPVLPRSPLEFERKA